MAHVENSRHAGETRRTERASTRPSHDVNAARRRKALATVALPGLKIVLLLASEIFSGQRMLKLGSQKVRSVALSILDLD